jgi:hypothetical protein
MRVALTAVGVVVLTTSAFAAPRSIRFKVVNNSPHVIEAVNVAVPSSPRWGDNLLVRGSLKPGASAVIELVGECGTYDLRFVATKGVQYLVESESFCADDDVVVVGAHEVKKSSPHN